MRNALLCAAVLVGCASTAEDTSPSGPTSDPAPPTTTIPAEPCPMAFLDADGDGFGAGVAVEICDDDPSYVLQDGDCDDAAASVHPDALDLCGDSIDSDCSGDEAGVATLWRVDPHTADWIFVEDLTEPLRTGATVGIASAGDVSYTPPEGDSTVVALCDGAFAGSFEVRDDRWLFVVGYGATLTPDPGRPLATVLTGFLGMSGLVLEGMSASDAVGSSIAVVQGWLTLIDLQIEDPVATGAADLITVIEGTAIVRGTTVDGFRGVDGAIMHVQDSSLELIQSWVGNGANTNPSWNPDPRVSIAPSGAAVDAHDSSVFLSSTLFEGHSGLGVLSVDRYTQVVCDGAPGIETGFVSNDGAALLVDYALHQPSFYDCDFGEGKTDNGSDVYFPFADLHVYSYPNDYTN